MSNLTRHTAVFVTGATGYVGRRVVESLLASGHDVSVLTRRDEPPQFYRAVTAVRGDLERAAELTRHLDGCDVVIHCAKADAGGPPAESLDVRGSAALCDAAIAANVRRFVHVSTISVYPTPAAGVIDESWPYAETDAPYPQRKIHIERALIERADRIQLLTLQPGNVYGRRGGWWSGTVPDLLQRGRMILVNGGSGLANLIHVDDVASAVIAAVNPAAPLGRYIITDGHARPWSEYFDAVARVYGGCGTVSMTASEARAYSHRSENRSAASRLVARAIRAVTREQIVFPLDDAGIDAFASKRVLTNARALRELQWAPKHVDFNVALTSSEHYSG